MGEYGVELEALTQTDADSAADRVASEWIVVEIEPRERGIFVRQVERATADAGERLQRTLRLPRAGPKAERAAAIELAIRFWARRDKDAAHAVQLIDHQRLSYYAKLFAERGCSPQEARKRAYIFYAALMSQAIIVTDDQTDVSDHLADLVIGA